jgi:cell division protein ZapD
VCEQRTDLKSEILKELERYRQTILGYRSMEGLEQRVNQLLGEIDQCYSNFNNQSGNLSTELNQNEWLLSVRGRINIPAGLCAFDHPSYFTWQHQSSEQRLRDLITWLQPLQPIMACVRLLMRLLRDTEVAQKVMTQEGVYQQSLNTGKNYQLLRISMQPNMQLIPTVSAHRLMVTVRMMRREGEKMLHAGNVQAGFELALCS